VAFETNVKHACSSLTIQKFSYVWKKKEMHERGKEGALISQDLRRSRPDDAVELRTEAFSGSIVQGIDLREWDRI